MTTDEMACQVVDAVEAWWQQQDGVTREQLAERLMVEAERVAVRHHRLWPTVGVLLAAIAAAGMVVQHREAGQ